MAPHKAERAKMRTELGRQVWDSALVEAGGHFLIAPRVMDSYKLTKLELDTEMASLPANASGWKTAWAVTKFAFKLFGRIAKNILMTLNVARPLAILARGITVRLGGVGNLPSLSRDQHKIAGFTGIEKKAANAYSKAVTFLSHVANPAGIETTYQDLLKAQEALDKAQSRRADLSPTNVSGTAQSAKTPQTEKAMTPTSPTAKAAVKTAPAAPTASTAKVAPKPMPKTANPNAAAAAAAAEASAPQPQAPTRAVPPLPKGNIASGVKTEGATPKTALPPTPGSVGA